MLDPPADVDEYARVLYAGLREADAARARRRLAVPPPPTGIGASGRRPPRGAPPRERAVHDDAGRSACSTRASAGLTVLRSLIDLLPGEPMVYFGDTGRFPYGPKPRDEVHKYALEIADVLVARGAKASVVACNSAAAARSTRCGSALDIPVVGVIEPGLRAAARVDTDRAGSG